MMGRVKVTPSSNAASNSLTYFELPLIKLSRISLTIRSYSPLFHNKLFDQEYNFSLHTSGVMLEGVETAHERFFNV